MLRMKHVALPVALTLALALTGCGQSASNGSTDTAGQATTEAAADDTTLEVPEDLAGAAEEMRSVDPEEVTDEAAALDAYAEAADAEDLAIEQVDEVEKIEEAPEAEAAEEAPEAEEAYEAAESAAAPSATGDYVPLYNGGMKIMLPSDWEIAWEGAGKYSFLSADHKAYGYVTAWKKESGHTYDVVKMMSSMPKSLAEQGYTGIEIVDSKVLSSTNGTQCDAYICLKITKDGKDYMRWYEFLESKSYITGLAMASTVEGWAANFDELGEIAVSVAFAPGEGI